MDDRGDLPKWTSNPLIITAIFGAALGAMLIIGVSDRAAEFAGSFFAALAAVIAVVVAGAIRARNDRLKEQREARAKLWVAIRELRVTLSTRAGELDFFAKMLGDKVAKGELDQMAVSMSAVNARLAAPLSDRTMDQLAYMHKDLASAVLKISSSLGHMGRTPPLSPDERYTLMEEATMLEVAASYTNLAKVMLQTLALSEKKYPEIEN